MAVKPTPSQEENDRAAMGEHVIEKEADGSPEDANTAPPVGASPPPEGGEGEGGGDPPLVAGMPLPEPEGESVKRKQMEGKPAPEQGYQTRQTVPARPHAPARDSRDSD